MRNPFKSWTSEESLDEAINTFEATLDINTDNDHVDFHKWAKRAERAGEDGHDVPIPERTDQTGRRWF